MDKYEYAVRQELKWLEDDIRITRDCIDGKEQTQWPESYLHCRLNDSISEEERLLAWMKEYTKKHEDLDVIFDDSQRT